MATPTPTNVLVVDDEKDVQWLFEQHFRREVRSQRLKFHYAFSGEGALQYLREQGGASVVLVLSDINMPGMTGLELLRLIKDEFPGLGVHMITAYGDDHNYQQAIAYGADGYLTKPINFAELRATLLPTE
jgi:CheY-like chemotaxis protein